MAASILNLSIEQGSTFRRTLQFKDGSNQAIDLTGVSFRGSIRQKATSDTIAASFHFDIQNPESDGIVSMYIPDSETALIPTNGASYSNTSKFFYDVEMIDSNQIVTRILNGEVLVSP